METLGGQVLVYSGVMKGKGRRNLNVLKRNADIQTCLCLESLRLLVAESFCFLRSWQMELSCPPVSSKMRWRLLSLRARCPAAWHSVAVEPMDHAAGAHLCGRKRSTLV